MNPFARQNLGAPPPRHPLGLWLNYRKLTSSAYVPSRRERAKLRGGEFYGVAINWALANSSADYFTAIVPAAFIATMIVADGTQGHVGPQYLTSLYDTEQGVSFSDQPVDQNVIGAIAYGASSVVVPAGGHPPITNVVFGGSLLPAPPFEAGDWGIAPFILKKPFLFQARDTIVVQIQNLTEFPRFGQVMIYGYLIAS